MGTPEDVVDSVDEWWDAPRPIQDERQWHLGPSSISVQGMRKSPIARWLALFMGAWLSLVQSDAGLFHACSAGNSAIAAHEAALTAPVQRSGHDVIDHSAHGTPQAANPAPDVASHHGSSHDNHEGGDQECHCIGHCCATVVPTLHAADTYPIASVVRIATSQPGRAAHEVMASWVDFVLPFPTAPPIVG